jgi:hypothetical protein
MTESLFLAKLVADLVDPPSSKTKKSRRRVAAAVFLHCLPTGACPVL